MHVDLLTPSLSTEERLRHHHIELAHWVPDPLGAGKRELCAEGAPGLALWVPDPLRTRTFPPEMGAGSPGHWPNRTHPLPPLGAGSGSAPPKCLGKGGGQALPSLRCEPSCCQAEPGRLKNGVWGKGGGRFPGPPPPLSVGGSKGQLPLRLSGMGIGGAAAFGATSFTSAAPLQRIGTLYRVLTSGCQARTRSAGPWGPFPMPSEKHNTGPWSLSMAPRLRNQACDTSPPPPRPPKKKPWELR